ncbi:MAG: hypothetical protein QOF48_353 [Verrucomicrobiota bacterium]|jgi:hypothetical protein
MPCRPLPLLGHTDPDTGKNPNGISPHAQGYEARVTLGGIHPDLQPQRGCDLVSKRVASTPIRNTIGAAGIFQAPQRRTPESKQGSTASTFGVHPSGCS